MFSSDAILLLANFSYLNTHRFAGSKTRTVIEGNHRNILALLSLGHGETIRSVTHRHDRKTQKTEVCNRYRKDSGVIKF